MKNVIAVADTGFLKGGPKWREYKKWHDRTSQGGLLASVNCTQEHA